MQVSITVEEENLKNQTGKRSLVSSMRDEARL